MEQSKIKSKIKSTNKSAIEVDVKNNLQPEAIFIQIAGEVNHNICGSDNIKKKHTHIGAGCVRVPSGELCVIPIHCRNQFQMFCITVYVEDVASKSLICIANRFQINRKYIEINRSAHDKSYIIVPYSVSNKPDEKVDSLFLSWRLPKYLSNSMISCGWNNIDIWHEISTKDLINMGFKRGHRITFFSQFNKYIANKKNDKNSAYALFKKWHLPTFLCINMLDNGWTDPNDWGEISDEQLQKMNFKDGHIVSFKKHIKLENHLIA